jgi:hypothetical protein
MIQIIGFIITFFSFIFLICKIRFYLKIRRQRQGEPYRGFFVEFYDFKKKIEHFDYPHIPIFVTINDSDNTYTTDLIKRHNEFVVWFWLVLLLGTFLMCLGEYSKS